MLQPQAYEGTPPLYVKIGAEYYTLGRTAVHRKQYQVVGNLFHHAFEMLMKALLLLRNAATHKELRERYRHDLPRLWEATKEYVGLWAVEQDWAGRFDSFVADLDRWEDIRYGGFPKGLPKNLRVDYLAVAAALRAKPGHDEYVINLERADELFKVLVTECSMNKPWFVRDVLIGSEALEDYERDNNHVIRDPP